MTSSSKPGTIDADEDLDEGSALSVSNGTARRVIAHLTVDRAASHFRADEAVLGRTAAGSCPAAASDAAAGLADIPFAGCLTARRRPAARVAGRRAYLCARPRAFGDIRRAADRALDARAKEVRRLGEAEAADYQPHAISRCLPDERDRRILDAICGAPQAYVRRFAGGGHSAGRARALGVRAESHAAARSRARASARPDRLLMRIPPALQMWRAAQLIPVEWDPQPAEFHLRITGDAQSGYTIGGAHPSAPDARTGLTKRAVRHRSADPVAPGSSRTAAARLAAFDTGGADRWMARPAGHRAGDGAGRSRRHVRSRRSRPRILRVSSAPTSCASTLRVEAPQPVVRITRATDYRGLLRLPGASPRRDSVVRLRRFRSGCVVGAASDLRPRPAGGLAARPRRPSAARSRGCSRSACGGWPIGRLAAHGWILRKAVLPTLVRVLLSEGWRVEADGRLYRRPGTVTLDVRSGIDWFELHGGVDFGGIRADLPTLLAAARRGDTFVPLGDGTFGLLPEDWLARGGRIAAIGTPEADHVRFAPSQAALLDAWLATQAGGLLRRGLRSSARRAGAIRRCRPPSIRRRRSAACCATISATRSAGSISSAGLGSAAASPTRWASARRSWCSPRWRPAASSASAPAASAPPVAHRRAAVARVQLEAGGGALRARAARARFHRRRPARRPRPRRRARHRPDHLRDAADGTSAS